MQTTNFYKDIVPLSTLRDISDTTLYKDVPESWFVIATDIRDSTKAIQQGRYKDVNMLGALCIISVLNIDSQVDIPFVFGGDGAFLLIPPALHSDARQAMIAIQKIAKQSYSMSLRISSIPVRNIYETGSKLLITKYRITPDYSQAIIKGGGLDASDKLLKSDTEYTIADEADPNFQLDLSGLECRWKAIRSPKDEVLSILIKASNDDMYKDILTKIDEILGDSVTRNPINQRNLQLSFNSDDLSSEAAIYTHTALSRLLHISKLKAINLIGKILMDFKINLWKGYKSRIISATDTEKFDDMLRMVVSATFEQTKLLEQYLRAESAAGKLSFGIHRSDSSLITCLIFERHGKHIHFVDASKGGYAMAAKMMKSDNAQMSSI